jgi:hypothetical protein
MSVNSYQGYLQFTTAAGVAAITIDTSQRVGIGTTSPTLGKLEVQDGTGGADKTVAHFGAHIYGEPSYTTYINLGTEYGDGTSRIGSINTTGNQSSLVFETHAAGSGSFTERMRITNGGNVLVGQTSAGTNGKLQVTGGIGLTGNSTIRSSTNSDNGDTIKFFGTQFVAGSNSHSYGYSEGGYIASLATAGNAILLDAGNTTANTGHRFRVINAGNGVDGSIQYWDGTTSRFHVDSSTGIIKENDIPVRSRAIAMAMVFG